MTSIAREVEGGVGLEVEEAQIYAASEWQLMWWRFRKHKLAMIGTVVVLMFYFVAIFAEFLAPYDPRTHSEMYALAPPQKIYFVHDGTFQRPFIYGYEMSRDPETYRKQFEPDREEIYPIRFFVREDPYEMWGLFEADLHLFGLGPEADARIHLFGTNRLGQDMLSRIIYGTRISLSIGLIGVLISFALGILFGGISGYLGGVADTLIQRAIDFLRSIPTIPLWMAMSASLPREWTGVQRYFAILVILSLIGWTGLARVVRGRFLALREEDFVMAARLVGASELRIVLRHLLPSFLSYIIASLTLSIPSMILGETSLSFLGLGLRAPTVSWGVLLNEAQKLRVVALAPWLLIPGMFVVVAVLAFNFMGDGIRDAADPYG